MGIVACGVGVVLFSIVYFIVIQQHNVELSFDQLSMFDRQVQTVGNRSVYAVEAGKRDALLASLSTEDWAKVSSRIDYVAFVYGEVTAIMRSANWVKRIGIALDGMQPPGYGVVLFKCGCVVPNLIFTKTRTRFDGFECAMLPGFIMAKDSVKFVDVPIAEEKCGRRNAVLGSGWYGEHSWKLEDARAEHAELRMHLEGNHA